MEPNNSTTPAAEASNPSEQKTPTKTEPRENVEASAAIIRQLNEVRAENEKIRAQLADEHKRRVRDAVSAECQRIGQADKIDSWTALAMSNPEVVDNLKAMASFVPGSEPVRGVITGGKDAIDIRAELRSPRERAKFDIQNFSDVVAAERHRARGMRGHAFAANTHSGLSTMLGTMISDGISTVLQQRCCALRALARDFGTDRMKPLTPVVFKQVQAGGAAVEDPTNFEDTTNFVGTIEPITITPNRCVVGAHLTAAELNSGLRLQDFYEIKGHELADKIMAKVAAVITTANFTATPFVSAAAAFSPSDMRTLNGRAKLFRKKALIVDGEYFSQLLPNTRDDFDVTQGGNWPGWDYVLLNTVWTGATANTVGFVLDPMRAIACVAGLPLLPSAGNSPINEITYTVPGIELAVSQNTWISTSTKTEWINWEVMFGAVKAETAAGIIIQSA